MVNLYKMLANVKQANKIYPHIRSFIISHSWIEVLKF